jgi:hypothetical protein
MNLAPLVRHTGFHAIHHNVPHHLAAIDGLPGGVSGSPDPTASGTARSGGGSS